MIEAIDYLKVMRRLASGVTIVTTIHEGKLFGMTATAFTSVSMAPMLVQVALDTTSRTHDAVRASGLYGVNILAEDQMDLARSFAVAGLERFEDIDYVSGNTGVPLLGNTTATLECRVSEEIGGGDHTIFVGEALHGSAYDRPPLIYFDTSYRSLTANDPNQGEPS